MRKPRSKPARARRPQDKAAQSLNIQWREDSVVAAPAPQAATRYFKLETLTSALSGEMETGGAFFQSVVTRTLRSRNLLSVRGALLFENDAHLEWLLSFVARNRNKTLLRLVVAKNDAECGEIVKTQFANLETLHGRIAKHVPTPLRQGRVFMPDRHGRKSHERRLPAYVTEPLPKAGPCAITKSGQFRSAVPEPKLLSQSDSDALKRRILELCLRSYDPRARNAMPPPNLENGALRITLPKKSRPDAFIAECRELWTRLTPATLLHRLTGFDWTADGVPVRLLPRDPQLLVQALVNAFGKRDALVWLRDYHAVLQAKKFTPHHRLPETGVADTIASLAS